jgi:hypothetical protein
MKKFITSFNKYGQNAFIDIMFNQTETIEVVKKIGSRS